MKLDRVIDTRLNHSGAVCRRTTTVVPFAPPQLQSATFAYGEALVIRQRLSPRRTTSASRGVSVPAPGLEVQATQANGSPSCEPSFGTDVLNGRFMIPASEVQRLVSETNMSMADFLQSLIRPASRFARPPISGYHVGVAGLGASGAVYVGVNLEFPGTALNNSVHGEQFLVVNCLHHGEEAIRMLAVSAAPCGHCRQFYAELYKADEVAFLFGQGSEACRPRLLDELLPGRFGPQDLSPDEPFPLLLQHRDNKVSFSGEATSLLAARHSDAALHRAASEALAEARKAYSPYTHCPSGAAIITQDGSVFSGGCIESAAYNPSLSPFHAAYIDAVTSGMRSFKEVKEVVVSEVEGAAVRHTDNIRLLLNSVAPQACLTCLPLVRES